MNLSDDFAFTQGSLQDFADCHRRFELRFIKRLRYPALEVRQALLHENRIRRGQRFHKLVQQHLLGLPAEALSNSLADDEEIRRWWDNYLARGLTKLPPERYAEITLQTHLGGYRLVAKYDLLALQPGGDLVIVDWKTGDRIPSRLHLGNRLQTIVYRYVLAQAGAHLYGEPIPPERVRMDYFYVAQPGERISFDYSTAQLQADEALLSEMITTIERAQTFELTSNERLCRYCTYRSFCERGEAGDLEDFDVDLDEEAEEEQAIELDFDQIAEIEF